MYTFKKPPQPIIHRFLAKEQDRPFTYPDAGATGRATAPPGYVVDHNRIRLGTGLDTFDQAKAALRRWEMFNLGWVQLCWPDTPLEPGATVGILAWALGMWSLNACRIVYTIEEAGPVARFGFAYGTLPGHIERGEERFTIEWHEADNAVWYDIYAFSQPNQLLARLGYPMIRRLQWRFARGSLVAMQRAVGSNHV